MKKPVTIIGVVSAMYFTPSVVITYAGASLRWSPRKPSTEPVPYYREKLYVVFKVAEIK
jgi:hypothetical protein